MSSEGEVNKFASQACVVRRFNGLVADELAIRCLPLGAGGGPREQSTAVYRQLVSALRAHGAGLEHITNEVLHVRRCGASIPAVLDGRAHVLADLPNPLCLSPALIEQPPVADGCDVGLCASAVVPRDQAAWTVRRLAVPTACGCDGCQSSGARIVEIAGEVAVHANTVYGRGPDPLSEALDMFAVAQRLLAGAGLTFRNVTRTWIYLREIDRDYDDLNRARRGFFEAHGIEIRPASTGVGGAPWPARHNVAMRFEAVGGRRSEWSLASTPTLNEAWTYGADFSRGVRVVDSNKVAVHVSGTASIDERGRTAHVGDCAAQARRMLANISTLLAGQGGGFRDIVSAVAYLRHARDASTLQAVFDEAGFGRCPLMIVEAPLCRPELLCETEAVALLPLPAASA